MKTAAQVAEVDEAVRPDQEERDGGRVGQGLDEIELREEAPPAADGRQLLGLIDANRRRPSMTRCRLEGCDSGEVGG